MENPTEDVENWKVLESEYLIRKPWMTVRSDRVEMPNGHVIPDYYIFEYPDWVNVIAITDNGEFLLERQYRHGVRRVVWEIPAGTLEKGESPLDAARRELMEETGYAGGEWTELLQITGNASSYRNVTHCYLARGVKRVSNQRLDVGEDINVFLKSESEVRELLECGEFVQSLMSAPLWKYFALHCGGK